MKQGMADSHLFRQNQYMYLKKEDMLTEKQIVSKYLGVPYLHHGRDLTGGDCWSLIILINKDRGIEILDLENYEQDWAKKGKNHFIDNYYKNWEIVTPPKFLDVLLFKNHLGVVSHAGAYLSDGKFIHTHSKVGTIISRLTARWEQRLDGIYRYKE